MSTSDKDKHLGFLVKSAGDRTAHAQDLLSLEEEGAGLKIRIKGPIGAPAQQCNDHITRGHSDEGGNNKVLVLIGSRIGVTPIMTILRNIVKNENEEEERKEEECGKQNEIKGCCFC